MTAETRPDPKTLSDADRLHAFGVALGEIKRDVEARLGAEDVAHVVRVDRFSRRMEVLGRSLIHLSLDPVTFSVGVAALFVHKQLQATEVGHPALHGAYDRLEGAERYRSDTFRWDMPIDEESWRHGHNVRHHGNTNIAGKDPDIHFGSVRLTEQTARQPHHRWQLPVLLLTIFPNFGLVMNGHFTGLNDFWVGSGHDGLDVLPDLKPRTVLEAHRKAFRKYVPYYARNYVLFPLLAGPMFGKVLLGNWLAETLRDVYSAATILCGHVGDDVKSWPEGTRARGKGAWYAMQVESTNNFEVRLPVSMLCGALDYQIEHHLFPKLPPNRLREIAPAVRAACEAHGVAYRTDSWGRTLRKALRHVARLGQDTAGALQGVGRVASAIA